MTRIPATLALALAAGPAFAECGASEAEIAAYLADWTAARPTAALSAGATLEEALCTQERLVAALSERLGPRVGWKAGLTSEAAQARFGAPSPVRGQLLRDMLLEDGATVPADFGARPLFEADLILVVADAAINRAETTEEVLAHISEIRPFLELPDIAVAEGEPIDAVTLTAGNVGARLGVVGAGIDVAAARAEGADLHAALAEMTVTVESAEGVELATAEGRVVLGHPAAAVLWLMEAGVTLAAGDMVSVGSIGPLLPIAKAEGAATVTYRGLPGAPSVGVVFAETGPAEAAARAAEGVADEAADAAREAAEQAEEIGREIGDSAAEAVEDAGRDLEAAGEAVQDLFSGD